MRIFDNPNHPQYGPVRRMWIVLVQLDLLNAAERRDQSDPSILPWDEWLALVIEKNPHKRESAYQRMLVYVLMEGWA